MKPKLKPLMTSDKQDWRTPLDFFNVLDAEFKFDADVADNSGITVFNRGKDGKIHGGSHHPCDSLSSNWNVLGKRVNTYYLNPPYKNKLQTRFIKQAAYVGNNSSDTVVCLIPSRLDTILWHEIIAPNASEIRFLKGRLNFQGGASSATFPSAVVVFSFIGRKEQRVMFWDWRNKL